MTISLAPIKDNDIITKGGWIGLVSDQVTAIQAAAFSHSISQDTISFCFLQPHNSISLMVLS